MRVLWICMSFMPAHRQTVTKIVTSQAYVPLEALKIMEGVKGVEPSLSAWEADNE